ncbi:hypothetical protein BH23ACT9_BH23ACT9_04800 [soil metagenome]
MPIDVGAFIDALREDPAQRQALRVALGVPDVDVHAALQSLVAAQERTEAVLNTMGTSMEELAQAQARTETRMEELAQAQARTVERLDGVAVDLDKLAATVSNLAVTVREIADGWTGMTDRLGGIEGDLLEARYRDRGHSLLQKLARRLRPVDSERLGRMVADAEDARTLLSSEAEQLMAADAVFSAILRASEVPVHLVVEVSVTVNHNDVSRSRERAALLARLVDTPVVGVVAGERVPEPVAVGAQDAGVWCVVNGRVLAPDGDLEAFL